MRDSSTARAPIIATQENEGAQFSRWGPQNGAGALVLYCVCPPRVLCGNVYVFVCGMLRLPRLVHVVAVRVPYKRSLQLRVLGDGVNKFREYHPLFWRFPVETEDQGVVDSGE